jgi:hypothetical protein
LCLAHQPLCLQLLPLLCLVHCKLLPLLLLRCLRERCALLSRYEQHIYHWLLLLPLLLLHWYSCLQHCQVVH